MGYNSVTEEQQNKCAELWTEYEPYMRNYCRIKLQGSNIDLDDTLCEISLALCNQIVNDDIPYEPKKWLYKTAKNIINARYKRKYKQDKYMADINTDSIKLLFQQNFVETVEANEQIQKIGELIPTLKKDSQKVLYGSYFNKRPMKEIAKDIGSTETAVKQKRYNICRKFEKELK